MRVRLFDFRHGGEILERRPAWMELYDVVSGIDREDVLAAHATFSEEGKRVPAGGQSALNRVFRDRLIPLGWRPEPRLFPSMSEGFASGTWTSSRLTSVLRSPSITLR
jgi:hypothetical protein